VLLVCTVCSVLYSEIALSRKPFGIGHMYIYTFLLRMTDTVTSQNVDISSWDILYIRVFHLVCITLNIYVCVNVTSVYYNRRVHGSLSN
jgi:hypothetical protein